MTGRNLRLKQCSKCGIEQPLTNFYLRKSSKDGYYQQCKPCLYAVHKKWNKANSEKVNLSKKAWVKANPEKNSASKKAWNKANPEKNSDYYHSRKARKLNNGVFIISKKFLKKLYESKCIVCGDEKNITADHIIPISRGGTHSEGNLQPLCLSCNSSKKNKTMTEWRKGLERE
jgi:hypothetical protein